MTREWCDFLFKCPCFSAQEIELCENVGRFCVWSAWVVYEKRIFLHCVCCWISVLYGDLVLKCRYFFENSIIFLIFTCTLSTAYSPFFDLFHAVQPQNPPFLLRLAIPLTQFKCHSALPNCLQSDYLCVFLYIVLNILCFLRRKFVPLHAITLLSESMKRLSVFLTTLMISVALFAAPTAKQIPNVAEHPSEGYYFLDPGIVLQEILVK